MPLDSAAAVAVLRSTCGEVATSGSFGLLQGEVRDADSQAVGAAAVTIAWRRPLDAGAAQAHPGGTTDEPALAELSDDQGHWHICGVPLRTSLSVRAVGDDGSDARVFTLDAGHPVASLDFVLHPDGVGSEAARRVATSALVVISVEDRDGHPLPGVTVDIAPENGTAHRAVSDTAGRAVLPAVEPGRAHVRSLAIGYRPGELVVPLDAGRNTVPLILDPVRIPTLATVRILGDREVLARHKEFEARRSLGQTTVSITAEDIEKRNPVDTWQMLTNIPSMRVTQYGNGEPGVYAMSTREVPVVQNRASQGGGVTQPCWYRLMLDGVALPDAMPDLSSLLPPPGDVHGIEVFAGLATVPPQYNTLIADSRGGASPPACGLIAVWTK